MAIFYLRAVGTRRALGNVASGYAEETVNIGFLVVADSALDAGARAHDAFREAGWTFDEYLSLPSELPRDLNAIPGTLRAQALIAMSSGELLFLDEPA